MSSLWSRSNLRPEVRAARRPEHRGLCLRSAHGPRGDVLDLDPQLGLRPVADVAALPAARRRRHHGGGGAQQTTRHPPRLAQSRYHVIWCVRSTHSSLRVFSGRDSLQVLCGPVRAPRNLRLDLRVPLPFLALPLPFLALPLPFLDLPPPFLDLPLPVHRPTTARPRPFHCLTSTARTQNRLRLTSPPHIRRTSDTTAMHQVPHRVLVQRRVLLRLGQALELSVRLLLGVRLRARPDDPVRPRGKAGFRAL